TVLADDPRLDVRTGAAQQPLRIIMDSRLCTPPAARILAKPGRVVLFSASDDGARRRALEEQGATIEKLADVQPPPERVLRRLAELEINELLIEAGPTLAGAFVQAGFADELLVYVAPVLLGPQARPLLQLPARAELALVRRFTLIESQPVGADLRLRLRPA